MSTHATTHETHKKRPLSKLTMKDVMTEQPVTVGRQQTLAVAHEMMRENRCRHLPVLEHGELVGVLTQRDLYFLETIAGVDMATDKVDDAMSSDAYAVGPDVGVQDVCAEMSRNKYGCAVVIERDRVIGIFTATDALAVLAGL